MVILSIFIVFSILSILLAGLYTSNYYIKEALFDIILLKTKLVMAMLEKPYPISAPFYKLEAEI